MNSFEINNSNDTITLQLRQNITIRGHLNERNGYQMDVEKSAFYHLKSFILECNIMRM